MNSQLQLRADYLDEDLRQRIECYFKRQHFPAFRKIAVDVDNGCVTLSGCVGSFYEKQVALNTCRRVAGVLSLIDQITVSGDPIFVIPRENTLVGSGLDYVG